jgi:hypothetical protein
MAPESSFSRWHASKRLSPFRSPGLRARGPRHRRRSPRRRAGRGRGCRWRWKGSSLRPRISPKKRAKRDSSVMRRPSAARRVRRRCRPGRAVPAPGQSQRPRGRRGRDGSRSTTPRPWSPPRRPAAARAAVSEGILGARSPEGAVLQTGQLLVAEGDLEGVLAAHGTQTPPRGRRAAPRAVQGVRPRVDVGCQASTMTWRETAVVFAQLVCQECGATKYSSPPANAAGHTHRAATIVRCECGGRAQVVRVIERHPALLENAPTARLNRPAANGTAPTA